MIHLIQRKKQSRQNSPLVYAVGGGKGGIGKSFITSNLALYMSKRGYRTLLIDLDFGGANAHTYLEVKNATRSVKSFLCNEVHNFKDVITDTQFRNLSMVTGSTDWSDESLINHKNMNRLFKAAKNAGFDKVIYDLGAGTNIETINAYLEADIKVAVSTPEPISIENTYQFLKRAFYHALKKTSDEYEFSEKVNYILENKAALGIKTPAHLLKHIEQKYSKLGRIINREMLDQNSYILINQCRAFKDQKVGGSLSQISRQYFGQNVQFLGNINYENKVWQSVRSMKPLALDSPDCLTLREFSSLFRKLETVENYESQNYSLAS